MTTFLDGPAQSKTLMLKRAPFFLRVVIAVSGEIDALDQLGDTPRADELVHVYVRQPGAQHNAIHLNTGRKPGGGWFSRAQYQLSPVQPDDATARRPPLWQKWCEAQAKSKHA